jgi:hypothetical protein
MENISRLERNYTRSFEIKPSPNVISKRMRRPNNVARIGKMTNIYKCSGDIRNCERTIL